MKTIYHAIAILFVGVLLAPTVTAEVMRSIRFRAVDDMGDALAGAQVSWLPYKSGLHTDFPTEDEQAVTDADGYCTVDFGQHPDAEGDNFEVRVETDPSHAGGLRVYPNQDYHDPVVITVSKQAPLHGVVRDESGKPIPDVVVGSKWYPRTHTDAQGQFTLWGQGNGATTLSFYKEGYAWTDFNAKPGDVEIVLAPGFSITFEVVGPDGKPLPGVTVSNGGFDLETDDMGRATTFPFPKGHKLRVQAWKTVGQAYFDQGDIALTVTGERPQLQKITLKRYVESTEAPQQIQGKVVMADTGEPVRSRIFVHSAPTDFEYMADKKARTDKSGTFTIPDLAKAVYFIQVRPTKNTLYGADGIVRVDCTEGSVNDLVLTVVPGTALSGRITHSDGSDPETMGALLLHAGIHYQGVAERGLFHFFNLPPKPNTARLLIGDVDQAITLAEAGKVTRDVDVVLNVMADKSHIRGVIVDSQGEPQSGLSLTVAIDTGVASNEYAHGETDGNGQFDIVTDHAGTGTIAHINAFFQFQAGNLTERRSMECPIVEDIPPFPVTPVENTVPLRIVVERPSVEVITGSITDEEANPLRPEIEFFTADKVERSYHGQVNDGHFIYFKVPEEAFSMSFTLAGHQARILEVDQDFKRGDRNIQVVLPRGPYPENKPIWTVITGKPWTQEVVDATIQSTYIRQHFDAYRKMAAPTVDAVPDTTPPFAQKLPVYVTDKDGKPITRISTRRVSGSQWHSYPEPPPITSLTPDQRGTATLLSSPDGHYEIPAFHSIWSEGTCHQVVGTRADDAGNADPIPITLFAKRAIHITVRDRSDEPLKDVAIVIARKGTPLQQFTQDGVTSTDERGNAVIDWLPPGAYVLGVSAYGSANESYAIYLADLTTSTSQAIQITTGPYPAGTGGAALDAMQKEWRNARTREDLASAWAKQPKALRKEMTEAAVAQLDVWGTGHLENLCFLAELSVVAELREAVPYLQNQFLHVPADRRSYLDVNIVDSIAELAGDTAIPFLRNALQDRALPADSRAGALMALNQIGTAASLAAWQELRDAARALPNTPAAQSAYTHEERMVEAIYLMRVLAGYDDGTVGLSPQSYRSTQVDEAYLEGRMYFGSTNYILRREGDEWLPVAAERFFS